MAELQDVLDKLDLVNDVKLEIKDVISTDSLHFEDYPNLIAEHLTSNPSEQTIADRTTANGATIKDGVAFLKALKGNSIKWNQLSNNLNIPVITSNGITFTKNADGSVSASGTATSSAYYIINLSATSGRKYALVGNPTGTSYGTYCLTAYGSSALVTTGKDAVFTPSANIVSLRIIAWNGNTINTTFRPMLFDLTAMGWEDITTADQFAQRLGFASANDIPSFPYDEGSIKHFSASEIVSKGINLWSGGDLVVTNERTGGDNVTASLKGGVTYMFSFESANGTNWRFLMRLKDKQGNAITTGVTAGGYMSYRSDYSGFFSGANNSLKQVPITCTQDAEMEIRIFQGDLVVGSKVEGCCLIEGNTYKGYKPYMTPSSLPLPSVSLYSAGTSRDELDLAQGKLTRRIGVVDMGTLTWGLYNGVFYSNDVPNLISRAGTPAGVVVSKLLCELYSPTYMSSAMDCDNMQMYEYTSSPRIVIRNDSYASASAFKTAMSGVLLYYELETPVTTDVDKSKAFYKVENGGREQVDVTTSSPLVATIAYEH